LGRRTAAVRACVLTSHARKLDGPFFRGHLLPLVDCLSSTDRLVLCVLSSFDYSLSRGIDTRKGYVFPSTSLLAAELGVSVATIKRSLKHLEECLFVVRTHQRRGNGKRDIRFIHLNYRRLERAHMTVLAWRKCRSTSGRSAIERDYVIARLQDDAEFLHCLISEGWIALSDVLRVYGGPNEPHHRELIHALLALLDRSAVPPSSMRSGWRNLLTDGASDSSQDTAEEDEVTKEMLRVDTVWKRSARPPGRRLSASILRTRLGQLQWCKEDIEKGIAVFIRIANQSRLSEGDALCIIDDVVDSFFGDLYDANEFASIVSCSCKRIRG